jgi:polyhydroxyalkanoate synthesis repressor PhaR
MGIMAEPLLIKKYENRRLYDTEKSTYIRLDDIAGFIKRGRIVKVVDAKTNADVTAFILTQIVLEQSKENSLLPVSMLHMIIQYGDNVLNDFFENYLQQILNNYLSYRAMADDSFRQWLDLGMDFSQAAQETIHKMTPLRRFMDMFPAKPPAPSSSAPQDEGPDKQEAKNRGKKKEK